MNHIIKHTRLSGLCCHSIAGSNARILFLLLFLKAIDGYTQKADTLSLLFVGDLMQHKAQIEAAHTQEKEYSYHDNFRQIKQELKNNDLNIANLEVAFGGKPYTGYPAFSAPDEYLYAIHEAGFNVLTTANNHCLDRGKNGLERTLNLLDSLHISHAGTYRNSKERMYNHPLLVEKRGFRIALLNYTYGTNGIPVTPPNIVNYIDKAQIKKDILKARLMKPDAIIVCIHWGIEYQSLPREEERQLAHWMIRLGADHIIGTHPHVIQPIIIQTDSITPKQNVIAYSLGNFISNMSAPQTDGGLAVKLVLRKVEGRTRLKSCNYAFIWTSRPTLNYKNHFEIYPSSTDIKSLNDKEKQYFIRFLKPAREFMQKYSKGIKEYFFDTALSFTLQKSDNYRRIVL